VFEGVLNGKRWEMQLKGGGRTPYCRGADGRAVLRSSIREFLAQEHMYALGVPTSRSLSLYTSKTEQVQRPWYSANSHSVDPDRMIYEDVAISTRVAPSFLRVGQIELFARRTRKKEHPKAYEELEKIVLHLIDREYSEVIDRALPLEEKVILLAKEFRARLTALVANWIRVGYCQGNFNSDNCAAGGFTLDFGPFGFIDKFDPDYQPWTGGGRHFAFLNQPNAAERNFHVFYTSLVQLVNHDEKYIDQLDAIRKDFSLVMQDAMEKMWASKLGLTNYDEKLYEDLEILMTQSAVDYILFFRELSKIPENITDLQKSFYAPLSDENIINRWNIWLEQWRSLIDSSDLTQLSAQMKLINPKYTLREWFLVPAYEQAKEENYDLIKELQEVMTDPYSLQSKEIEEKYYRLKPTEFFKIGGISHISCSS
ncbi:MAG: protein adenylyltransferase SelO family protein, partial [Arcobacteraceae bacterium]